ncbi:MAG: hypothetical protein A3J24_09425 [Deltaproteobacteria bacterium RIFCSPLOWO2_02_FULL_53_8]|nr:MAG: hypothetical protein A3J24_09425 [Deltaproteobacteria bacterium RIFCSPLOWO2_02_FULL_53_8]
MSGNILKLVLVTLMATFLASCAKEPPKCSDEDTSALVRKIVVDQIGGSEGVTEKEIQENLKIELPRASAFDEKIKKYSCEAKLIAGGVYQLPITYETQLDDKNQHLVVVGGIRRSDLFGIQAGMIEGIRKSRTAKVGDMPAELPSPKAPEQPPTAAAPSVPPEPAPIPTAKVEQSKASPPATWKPSFDCAKGSTFSEKAVCSDSLLGQLDGVLSQNYKYMLASDLGDGARADLKTKQRIWLAERNKCTDNQCLTASYRKRIDEVCEYPVISGVHPICTNSDEIK